MNVSDKDFKSIRSKISPKNETSISNNLMWLYTNVANKIFNWEDIPKEIPQYVFEWLLFTYGRCVIVFQEGKFWCLRVAKAGKLDAYGRMVSAYPISLNDVEFPEVQIRDDFDPHTKKWKKANAVLVKNNLMELPTMSLMLPFLERMNYIWQTLGIAEANIRTKRIIHCADADQKNILQAEANQITGSIRSLIALFDKSMLESGNQGLTSLPAIESTNDLKDIWFDFNQNLSIANDILGIQNNPDSFKSEKQTDDEINSNNPFVDLTRASMLECRQDAIADAKKIWPEAWGKSMCVSYFDHKNVEMDKWYKEHGMENPSNKKVDKAGPSGDNKNEPSNQH